MSVKVKFKKKKRVLKAGPVAVSRAVAVGVSNRTPEQAVVLFRHMGNSDIITVPSAFAAFLGWKQGDRLDVASDGDRLLVAKARE